jgi:AraC-like DNA-binding protein
MIQDNLGRIYNSNRNPIFFVAEPNHGPMYHSGRPITASDIVFSASGSEHHHRALAASHWAAMSLTPEDLATAGRTLVGRELRAPPMTRIIRPPARQMAQLMSLHKVVGDLAASAPDVVMHPEVARAIEEALVRAMIACIGNDDERIAKQSPNRAGLAVMKRFEQFLEGKQGEPVYVSDCCAALGVTDRTLRSYCQEHLGMGAHRYLWLRRMHLARRALAVAHHSMTTVTTIANNCGFGELGRFAATYCQLFGESPSATLHRLPDIV